MFRRKPALAETAVVELRHFDSPLRLSWLPDPLFVVCSSVRYTYLLHFDLLSD